MPLTRRGFLLTSAAVARAAKSPAGNEPNIVLILADALPAWTLGCYGNVAIRTPNIDLLARSGMRFMNHHVCAPTASASRATLLTGLLPQQHGIVDSPQGRGVPPASMSKHAMLSDLLAGAGYSCGYIGEWGLGDNQKPGHNFEFTYTMMANPAGDASQDLQMSLNGKTVQAEGSLSERITKEASRFIGEQKPEGKYLLVVSYPSLDNPAATQLPQYSEIYAKSDFGDFSREPVPPNSREKDDRLKDLVVSLRKYAAAVSRFDDQVGSLISTLNSSGLRDDTLVLFTCTSGRLLGRHGLWGGARASDPVNLYEEVIATPMIWNWRGKIPVEAVRPELISDYDLLPTLCELTGAPVPKGPALCGHSYSRQAFDQQLERGEWRNLTFGRLDNTETVRDARYKLILRDLGKGQNELYDLRNDPRERTNQYDNMQFLNVKERLGRELEAWRKECA